MIHAACRRTTSRHSRPRTIRSVLGGRINGEQALFGDAGIIPWVKYFSNDNPMYAVSNTVGAIAAAQSAAADTEAILEIGGGLGSGTSALLGPFRPYRPRGTDRLLHPD